MILFYVPCSDKEEALEISRVLIEEKLIACSNVFESLSNYFWQEKLKQEGEWVLIAKTLEKKKAAAIKRIKEIHSYSCPCILSFSVEANQDYVDWVKGELGQKIT